VLGDPAAALPIWQRAAIAITLASRRHHDAIDQNVEADAANSLAGDSEHVLQKRYTARQIIAGREKLRDGLRRHDGDEIGDAQMIFRQDMIEADRDARRSIPDEHG
jgi:hypothetical protein